MIPIRWRRSRVAVRASEKETGVSESHDSRERSSLISSNGAAALGLIAADLALVEEKLAELLVSREPLLSEISMHLISGGGKRVRPAVALLVFKACGGADVVDMIDVAVALELIHSATLLHDDIIDGGKTRRCGVCSSRPIRTRTLFAARSIACARAACCRPCVGSPRTTRGARAISS